jgi:hypothetical protein
MSGFVSVNIDWDGTFISVSTEHDRESRGEPGESTTKAHDVIEMVRDCALRAEGAIAARLSEVDR